MTLVNFLDSGGLNNTAIHLASANHVVLVTDNCSERKHWATENLLLDAWENHFISHLLVFLNDCGDFAFYDVISKGHNQQRNGIVKWIDVAKMELEEIYALFTHVTKNFQEYPIRFALFNRYATMVTEQNLTKFVLPTYIKNIFKYSQGHSGLDGIALSYLVQKLNLKPEFNILNEPNYGAFNKKTGLFDGTMGYIAYNNSDVAINGRYIKDYGEGTYNALEFLNPILFDSICIVVPKAQEIQKWRVPLVIFNIYSWIALFVMQMTASVVWFLLKKWEKR